MKKNSRKAFAFIVEMVLKVRFSNQKGPKNQHFVLEHTLWALTQSECMCMCQIFTSKSNSQYPTIRWNRPFQLVSTTKEGTKTFENVMAAATSL